MSTICPETNQKVLYTHCLECTDKLCRKKDKNKTFYLLIAGTRTYDDYFEFCAVCDHMLSEVKMPVCIVSGGAKGADALAERYAKEHDHQLKVFPARWNKYGKKAGPLRNIEMNDYISEHDNRGCLCLWDGKSKGTESNFKLARERGTRLSIWNYIKKQWVK